MALAGLFTVGSTVTLLVVSLADIARDLGSDVNTLNWAITAPMLGFGILGPAFGKAGDLWGHKRIFCFGLIGAGVFAAATALAWGPLSMIAFRTLSAGLGSATGPSALAMINRVFVGDERIKALGYWSLIGAAAPVVGVVGGGPLVAAVGWRVIFAVQAPLCVAGFVIALRLMPQTPRRPTERFDAAGAALAAVAVTSLLLAVNRAPVLGPTHPFVLVSIAVAPIAAAAFVAVERRVASPLVPLRWLRQRTLVISLACPAIANFAYMGGFLLAPQQLAEVLGLTTTAIAYVTVCRPLAFSVAAPLGTRATLAFGARASAMVGFALVSAAMVLFAVIDRTSPVALAATALGVAGIGLGLASPAMTATVTASVDPADLGVAGALSQLMTQMGSVVGSQAMLAVATATAVESDPAAGFTAAFVLGAVVSALAVVAAGMLPRSSPARRVPRSRPVTP